MKTLINARTRQANRGTDLFATPYARETAAATPARAEEEGGGAA